MPKKPDWLSLGILAAGILAAIILYAPTLSGPFLCDDFWYLDQCATNHLAPHPALAALRKGNFYYFRPLPSLAWSGQFAVFGARPLGYRVVNLGLHLAVVVAVFLLGRRAFKRDLAAALAALLFAIHPLHAEAVVWLSSSADLFAALFVAAGLERWLAWREGQGGRWPVAALILCALALLSKESAYVFAGLILATEFLPASADGAPGRPRRERLRAFALFVALTAALLAVKFVFSMGQLRPPTGASPPTEWPGNFFELLRSLISIFSEPPGTWDISTFVFLMIFAWGLIGRRHETAFSLCCSLVALAAPAMVGGLGPGLFFSRVLYLPSMGICLAIGVAVIDFMGREMPVRSMKGRILQKWAPILLPAIFILGALNNIEPWLRAAEAERGLQAELAGLAKTIPAPAVMLVRGVPPILEGVPFHPNSYFLSIDCSLALDPAATLGRATADALPCYAVSAEAPAIEVRGLPLKTLRDLKARPESSFPHILNWSPPK